jgi:hypothetical protein
MAGIILRGAKGTRMNTISRNIVRENNVVTPKKPKVVFICDVRLWAWHLKALELKKWLSNEFDIDIVCLLAGEKITKEYNIYFTFGYSYIDIPELRKIPAHRKVTGITAHRPLTLLEPKMALAGYTHANSMLLLNDLKFHINKIDTYIRINKTSFYYDRNRIITKGFYKNVPNELNNIILGIINGRILYDNVALNKIKNMYSDLFLNILVKSGLTEYISNYFSFDGKFITHDGKLVIAKTYIDIPSICSPFSYLQFLPLPKLFQVFFLSCKSPYLL